MKYIRDEAFGYCYDLEEVICSDNNLQIIGNRAFYECEKLKYFNIPDTVLVLGLKAFKNCFSCDIYDASKKKIGHDFFKNCKSVNYLLSENSLKMGNFDDKI